MASAMSDLGGIGGGLILNIVRGVGILVFAVALFYITRYFQKNSKKNKAFTTKAVIVDMNGVIDFDDMAFIKSDETGMLEMEFKIRKTDSVPPIPKHLIKNSYVLLLNYAPGHYCVIDTSETSNNFYRGINSIVPYNLGMKKYITAKQREIMNKAELKKKNWELYAPWISLSIGIVAACLLAWALFYFGAKLDAQNITARFVECKALMGK